MNIYEKLQKVQTDLKVPKTNYNKFGKYKYRSCEDILEALKPLLAKYKLALTLTDDIELIGDRYYLVATATLLNTEELNQVIKVQGRAREDENKKGMDLSQITGSVSSYARKYALNGLFCIDDTKDSDATNVHESNEDENKKIEKDKVDVLHNQAKLKGVDISTMLRYYRVTGVEDMTLKQWQHAINYLKQK